MSPGRGAVAGILHPGYAEMTIESRLPYASHVAPHVICTQEGDYLLAFRLTGISHDTADDAVLNQCHERMNILWRSIASAQLALWTHVVRRRATLEPSGAFTNAFAAQLQERYRQRLTGQQLLANELYLSIVYRPHAGVAQAAVGRWLARGQAESARALERQDSLEICEKLRTTIQAALADCDPQALGMYELAGQSYSSLLEFLGLLLNGYWQRMPLPRGPIARALGLARPMFGAEAMEYRSATHTRLAAFIGIKEYAANSTPTMFDALLRAPLEFVMTHSFTFLSQVVGQSVMQRKWRQLQTSGDFAATQAEELREALDAHASGEFVLGDHHCTVQILTDTYEGIDAGENARRLKALNDRLAEAMPLLQSSHLIVAREDLALEAAFWSQLPGCFRERTRKATVSSRNFACFAPMHGSPAGRVTGNHWGDAIAVFPTSAHTPYHFSLHAAGTSATDTTRADNGHTFVCGPTGSGKTVFIGFLIAMLLRQQVTQIVIDKDRGLELLVRALEGEYLPLRAGQATGFNPLQLPDNPANLDFLRQWLVLLGEPQGATEEADLNQALRGTLALPSHERRLSRLIEFLDATQLNGLWMRMARWCESQRGEYAWVFDNAADSLVPRLGAPDLLGIDVTDLLGHPLVRTPVTAYLLHLIAGLLDGRRLVCWMEEFSSLLDAPVFAALAKNGLRTWRKLDGVLVLCAQSPHDVVASDIARTLIEQVATRVFFPNAQGAAADYVEGFGLSQREFQLVRDELNPGARQFLIKQGRASVVCSLDLSGFDEELAIISGRARTLSWMRELMEAYGARAGDWLPAFMERLQAERSKSK